MFNRKKIKELQLQLESYAEVNARLKQEIRELEESFSDATIAFKKHRLYEMYELSLLKIKFLEESLEESKSVCVCAAKTAQQVCAEDQSKTRQG